MIVTSLFEVAVNVRDLDVSAAFYKDVLGLKEGLFDADRRWLFLWIGDRGGTLVLQEDKRDWPRQHFAFRAAVSDLQRTKNFLQRRHLIVEGPVSLGWMNAISLYFVDPDGHELEICAPTSGMARQE